MPDRNNEREWIRQVLGSNLTGEQLSSAEIIHRRFHELDGDKTLTPKLKPVASEYLTMQAVVTLTPQNTAILELSHSNMPEHEINPQDK